MAEKNDTGKILSFDRNAEYHFERFQKHADSGNYIESLVALRSAIFKDPSNAEYKMSQAELYTEMEYYEDSNAILFELLFDGFDFGGDTIFGMGCNFFGLRDYDKAGECFEKYIDKYPSGEFYYDALDMLDMLDDEDDFQEESELSDQALELSDKGKYYLDVGEYDKAAAIMKKLTLEYPSAAFIKNNLSLAYYCAGKKELSQRLSREVLEKEPMNLHAVCNLALFCHASGEVDNSKKYIDLMEDLKPKDSDELLKIMLTYCEIGEHEKAYSMIRRLLEEKPFDQRVLFLCAASCANTGRFSESVNYFMDMLRIDPDDTIALYYKNAVVRTQSDGGEAADINYVYQVPVDEIKNRLIYLNDCVTMDNDELKKLWESPEKFLRKILIWGLNFADTSIKRVCAGVLQNLGDEEAVSILKRFLLRESEPDDVKNDIFLILSGMGIHQPFVAYVSGKIAEVRVGAINSSKKLSRCHEELFSHIIGSSFLDNNKALIPAVLNILNAYFESFENAPIIRNYSAWAAAFLYFAIFDSKPDLMPPLDNICSELHAEKKSVLRCMRLIVDRLDKEGMPND